MMRKMLWSLVFSLLLAGAAFANSDYGFQNGKQYTYKIRSRTVTTVDPQFKQYAGVLIEGRLTLQPHGKDIIRAKISQPRYSQIHTHLENGWESEIPSNQRNNVDLPFSGEPFEIKMKNGVVKDLVVDKNVLAWEANLLRSIVSQLQADTRGENVMSWRHNQLPENHQPYASFKTMEDTVGGKCEVRYDMSPLTEQEQQNKPELVPMPELRKDGETISIVKTKNYSNCEQRVVYNFGLDGRNNWKPSDNDNGNYLSRSSMSRIVVTGNTKSNTIQSSVTINKVMHNSRAQSQRKGMVASKMNLTLNNVEDASEPISPPSNPQSIGNLVYSNDSPSESQSSSHSSHRSKNSNEFEDSNSGSDSAESTENNDRNSRLQSKPKMTEAPEIPMSLYSMRNHETSNKKTNKIDVVKSVKDLAQRIANDFRNPDNMMEEETLEKFSILSGLIRTMNAEQIAQAQRELYEQNQSPNQLSQNNQEQQNRRNAWVAFRDAVALSGTGPALMNIKQWIANKQIKGMEAASVVDNIARSARYPTPEFTDTYFDMLKMPETKEDTTLRHAAILSFADLMRHVAADKRSSHNRYPVHAFGRLFPKANEKLKQKYIPYMAEKLKAAVDSGDSEQIQVYITALGKTGHPQILSVFKPYFEGRKQMSPFQRFVMVLSLNKLTGNKPRTARSVLYKIYSNTAEDSEIRCAAAFLLVQTNPPVNLLQRMAEFTNFDSNKQVNSAVKSIIESLAKLDDNGNNELAKAARAAQPLLTSENYGFQYSKMYFMDFNNPFNGETLTLRTNWIGSDDSNVPKGAYFSSTESNYDDKKSDFEFGGVVSSIRSLYDFVENNYKSNNNPKAQNRKNSPENIAKLFNIYDDEPQQVEGFLFMNDNYANHFKSFDNHTLEKIQREIIKTLLEMGNGKNFDETKLNNDEITISFPTETGFPFRFTSKSPTLKSINGQSKLEINSNQDNQFAMPKSIRGSSKMRMIYSMKTEKRFSFIAPFENKEYVAGIDKNIQVHLPIEAEVEANQNKEIRFKLEPQENENGFKILQYKVQPYTSQRNIYDLEPVANNKNTHVIRKDRAMQSRSNLDDRNHKQLLEFTWEKSEWSSNENNHNHKNSFMSALKSLHQLLPSNADSEYQKYSMKFFPRNNLNVEMRISYDSSRTENSNSNKNKNNENHSPNVSAPHLDARLDNHERKQKLLNEASKNMNFAHTDAVDIDIQVNGDPQTSLTLTAARSNSYTDLKSRFLLYVSTKSANDQAHYASIGYESKNPNTNLIDFEEILKANTRSEYNADLRYGTVNSDNDNNASKVKIQAKMEQSEDRKNEVRQSRDGEKCTQEKNEHGNKMTPTCQNARRRAASSDKGDVIVTFENENTLKNLALNALDMLQWMSDPIQALKNRQNKENENKITVKFEISSTNERADVMIMSPEGQMQFNNVNLNPLNENNRNTKTGKNEKTTQFTSHQNSMCNLDKTQVETFDNRRYDLKMEKCWHVVLTTYPKNSPDASSQTQEIPESMQVSVLSRENMDGKKDMKVTLGDTEVELWPHDSDKSRVKVNGEWVELSKKKVHQEKKQDNVVLEIFEWPDRSVELLSDKYDIRVLYDGSRAEIKAGQKYRNHIRGLCGNNDGEPENDQQTPKGCTLKKSAEFSATWALTNDEKCEGQARENAEKAKKSKCVFSLTRPGNVINEEEIDDSSRSTIKRNDSNQSKNNDEKQCTHHRTRIMRTDNEICFSTRPVPTCSLKCKVDKEKTKPIQYHCVTRNSASEKIAKRIEDGANPDLSQKSVSKTEMQSVPTSCRA